MKPPPTIPSKLKSADLTRFINRAAQLETVKPVVAYWCEYWIVNQILAKNLHNGDPETYQFTTVLMDKLEQMQIKAENPTNDAILDDIAGQIYIEQFAVDTFQRAEKALKANKATKQTASTFQAAATFFELINIWSAPDVETAARIKYAKWNAVRILRAISEGRDPNISNPKQDIDNLSTFPKLESIDERINDYEDTTNLCLPTIEDATKATNELNNEILQAPKIPSAQNLLPENSTNVSEETLSIYDNQREVSVKAISTTLDNMNVLNNISKNIGESPEVSTFNPESSEQSHGTASLKPPFGVGISQLSSTQNTPHLSGNFESFPPPTLSDREAVQFQNLDHISSHLLCTQQSSAPVNSFQSPDQQHNKSATKEELELKSPYSLRTDDISIAKAQKHARWAISALNFEDTDTAVRELKEALKTLGID
ncbi:hypothetical protein GcM1_245149 [Golovinomyces cichoracearum]|uniref:Vacuolar protein sorting-associated protein vts1 n=1 Tax=Golovinomyces cichoracearum TaxID=62708 RepID=A0A420IFF5_9PEZI|nr:hypothetical protein GcM1_245149 [Golovinomyces cichoracearum]